MARTISVTAMPHVYSPALEIYNLDGTLSETVQVFESTTVPGKYTGPLTSNAGEYSAVLVSQGRQGIWDNDIMRDRDPVYDDQ